VAARCRPVPPHTLATVTDAVSDAHPDGRPDDLPAPVPGQRSDETLGATIDINNIHDVAPGPHGPFADRQLLPDPVAGQLNTTWQITLAVAWTAAFFAFCAVWKASSELGIGTWWLGARAQPRPILVKLMPFVWIIGIGMLAVYNVRRVALLSCLGSFGLAVIAVFDMSRSGGLAAIEFAIAAAMLLVSVGALSGTYRPAPAATSPAAAA
jgi:hypothetical protein